MHKIRTCYWCGTPADSKEHVPPESFFKGTKKLNLITVPSCRIHNENFNQLDQRMWALIPLLCQSPEAMRRVDAIIRSFLDPKAPHFMEGIMKDFVPVATPTGAIGVAPIPKEDVLAFLEKVTRALYYRHFNSTFEAVFSGAFLQSFHTSSDGKAHMQGIAPLFHNPKLTPITGKVSHPEIFQYRYIRQAALDPHFFAVAMKFYNDIIAFTVLQAVLKDHSESL